MRLIDADKEWSADASDNTGYRIEYKHGIMSLYSPEGDALCEFMPDNPTAYDVDKVAEQIISIRRDDQIRFAEQVICRTLTIVKKGGVKCG